MGGVLRDQDGLGGYPGTAGGGSAGWGWGRALRVPGGVLRVSKEGGWGSWTWEGFPGRGRGGRRGAWKGPGRGPEKSGGVGKEGGRRPLSEADGQVRPGSAEGSQRGFQGDAAGLPVLPGPRGPQRGAAGLRRRPGGPARAVSLPAQRASPSPCRASPSRAAPPIPTVPLAPQPWPGPLSRPPRPPPPPAQPLPFHRLTGAAAPPPRPS